MGRHNNPDALLILCCVAALWFMVRALEDGRTKWVVWAGVMVGLAFETKMLAAFLVVPGLVLAFLWVAPRGRVAAAKSLALGGAALAVVGGAWPVLMWLTPASSRPWISGTTDNSIWSLIFGYNGVGRLDGQAGGPGRHDGRARRHGRRRAVRRLGGSVPAAQRVARRAGRLAAGLRAGRGGRARSSSRACGASDARTGFVIAVGGCFAVCAVAFSFAQGIFHPYYVSQLAPFTAALVGAGVALAVRVRWVGPALIVAGVLVELVVIDRDAADARWAIPLVVVVGILAIAALVLRSDRRARLVAIGAALAALLAAPAAWSFQTLGHATGTTFPAGGPSGSGTGLGRRRRPAACGRGRLPRRTAPAAAARRRVVQPRRARRRTSKATAAGPSASPASRARARRSSRRARRSRASAASPAARAPCRSSGSPRRSATAASAGSPPSPPAACSAAAGADGRLPRRLRRRDHRRRVRRPQGHRRRLDPLRPPGQGRRPPRRRLLNRGVA